MARNPIEELAARVQTAPWSVLWLYGQQDLVYARGLGQPLERGPRIARVDKVLAFCARLGLPALPVWVASLLLTLDLYRRQGRGSSSKRVPEAAFVGLSAMRDPQLANDFAARTGRTPVLFDQTELMSFARALRVPLLTLLGVWLQSWKEIAPHLRRSVMAEVAVPYLRTQALVRLHSFAYTRAWFRIFLARGGHHEIGFSAASEVSQAAICEGAHAVYMPHGFQRRSIVLPHFAEAYASNYYEAQHFRDRLPGIDVRSTGLPRPLTTTERKVAVAGEFWPLVDFELCRSFIDWACSQDMPVVVRPHPRDETGYWDRWRGISGLSFDTSPCDFETFLARVRPRFLMTWTSTTIFDAVVHGVVPVTVTPEDKDNADFVVPLRDIAIPWPEGAALVARLSDDADACRAEALRRRAALEYRPGTAIEARR